MTATCRVCSAEYEPTPRAILRRNFICRPCAAEVSRNWVAKRKAAGLPVRKPAREYHRAYDAKYVKRPEVRAMRVEQARHRYRDPVENLKARVRAITRDRINRGKLVRQPCEVCGEIKVDAHHDDYSKPLEVRWLCRLHHRQHHAKLKEQDDEK